MRPVYRPKKPAHKDWHNADIKAALEKAGWSFRRLAAAHGYSSGLCAVLRKPWLQAERVVAAAIGTQPELIWPSRYAGERRTNPAAVRHHLLSNDISARAGRNVRARRAA